MRKERRRQQEKKRFWTLFVLLSLLLPYFQMLGSAFPEKVVAENGESSLLKKENVLNVSSRSVAQGENVQWTLHFDKAASTTLRQFRLKIQVGDSTLPVTSLDAKSQENLVANEAWLVEKEFSEKTTTGDIQFTTQSSVKPQVFLQVAEQPTVTTASSNATESSTTASSSGEVATLESEPSLLLIEKESGPYELVGPIAEKEKATSTTTTSTAESAVSDSSTQATTSTEGAEEETTDSSTASGDGLPALKASQPASVVPKVDRRNLAKSGNKEADPFSYINHDLPTEEGYYASNSTSEYIGLDATGTNPDTVRNYNFGKEDKNDFSASGATGLYDISQSQNLNFSTGYMQYNDALIKKTVAPSKAGNSNDFDITLDVISNAQKNNTPLDIVFVVDKSTSMNDGGEWVSMGDEVPPSSVRFDRGDDFNWNSNYNYLYGYDDQGNYYGAQVERGRRGNWQSTGDYYQYSGSKWDNLQKAMQNFIPDLLSEDNIRLALTSFGSEDISKETNVFTDVTSFDGSPFSSNPDKLLESSIITKNPNSNSGTPSFLGLDSGVQILKKGNPEAQKVLIFLSDGLPTFYGKNYNSSKGQYYEYDPSVNSQNNVAHYDFNWNFGGTGSDDCSAEAIDNFTTVYNANSDINYMSIAYGKDSFGSFMNTVGKNGSFQSATGDDLKNAMETISSSLTGKISGGTITDYMSEFVTLDTETVKRQDLSLDENARLEAKGNLSKVSADSKKISLDGVNLALDDNNNRVGIRITYTVNLKEEYRDGKFHLTNGPTYLDNGVNYEYVPVPSVRGEVPTQNFSFTKVGGANNPLNKITFELKDTNSKVIATATSEEDGTVYFTDIQYGAYTLVETNTPDGRSSEEYPITVNEGGVSGLPNDGSIVNPFNDFKVNLEKVDDHGNAIKGVTFELRDAADNYIAKATTDEEGKISTFSGNYELKVGPTYHLVETEAPAGYEQLTGFFEITLTDEGNEGIGVTTEYSDSDSELNDNILVGTTLANKDNTISLKIVNKKVVVPLPSTGGSGIVSYVAVGLSIITMTTFYFFFKKKVTEG